MNTDKHIEYDVKGICLKLTGLIGGILMFNSVNGLIATKINSIGVLQKEDSICVSIFTDYGKIDVNSLSECKELYICNSNAPECTCLYDLTKNILPN